MCVCVHARACKTEKKRDSSPDANTPGIYLWGSLVQSTAWAIHLFLAKWTSGVQFEMPTSLDGISKPWSGWRSARPKWEWERWAEALKLFCRLQLKCNSQRVEKFSPGWKSIQNQELTKGDSVGSKHQCNPKSTPLLFHCVPLPPSTLSISRSSSFSREKNKGILGPEPGRKCCAKVKF